MHCIFLIKAEISSSFFLRWQKRVFHWCQTDIVYLKKDASVLLTFFPFLILDKYKKERHQLTHVNYVICSIGAL